MDILGVIETIVWTYIFIGTGYAMWKFLDRYFELISGYTWMIALWPTFIPGEYRRLKTFWEQEKESNRKHKAWKEDREKTEGGA